MPRHRFTKPSRLLKSEQFDRVFKRRCSKSDSLIVIYACENDVDHPRLGLVVSRKVGNSVQRSRWKRCIREAFRLSQHVLPPSNDLVVLPRPGATPETAALKESLIRLSTDLAKRLAGEQSPS